MEGLTDRAHRPGSSVSKSVTTRSTVIGSCTKAARRMKQLIGGDPEIDVIATQLPH